MSWVDGDLQISYGWLEHDVNDEKEQYEFVGYDVGDPLQRGFSRILGGQELSNRDEHPFWQRRESISFVLIEDNLEFLDTLLEASHSTIME